MRRPFIFVVAASFVLGVPMLPAEAAPADLADRVHRLHATGIVTFTDDGRAMATDLTGAEVVLDAAGRVVDRLPFQAHAAAGGVRAMGMTAACVHDSNRPGFTPHLPPIDYPVNKKNEKGGFKFHFYSQDEARHDHRGKPTVQFLGCGVGGVDGQNGSRIRVSGPGIAFNDAGGSNILGTRWKEGKTPEDYSINLGFEVPVRGVTVTGSIQQHPSNYLKGSVVPPYGMDEMERLHRNGVNAWWEDGCRPRCTRFGGSNNYQGSVGEGLWEFPQSYKGEAIRRGWRVAAYLEHHCSNPFGC